MTIEAGDLVYYYRKDGTKRYGIVRSLETKHNNVWAYWSDDPEQKYNKRYGLVPHYRVYKSEEPKDHKYEELFI